MPVNVGTLSRPGGGSDDGRGPRGWLSVPVGGRSTGLQDLGHLGPEGGAASPLLHPPHCRAAPCCGSSTSLVVSLVLLVLGQPVWEQPFEGTRGTQWPFLPSTTTTTLRFEPNVAGLGWDWPSIMQQTRT